MSTVERADSGQRLSTTLVLAIAAVGCALLAIFGEDGSFRAGTIAPALLGLVPWALEAAGVRVPPALFAAWSLGCAAAIVLWQENPGGMFPVMVMVVWVLRETGDLRVTVPTIVVSAGLIIGLADHGREHPRERGPLLPRRHRDLGAERRDAAPPGADHRRARGDE